MIRTWFSALVAVQGQSPCEPKELLQLHSDHRGAGQQPRVVRREAWLSALVKGEPVTLKTKL